MIMNVENDFKQISAVAQPFACMSLSLSLSLSLCLSLCSRLYELLKPEHPGVKMGGLVICLQ